MQKITASFAMIFLLTLSGCSSSSETSDNAPIANNPEISSTNEPGQYNTFEEYHNLIIGHLEDSPYITSAPSNVIQVANITLPDTDFATTSIQADVNWTTKKEDEVQEFYIKFSSFDPTNQQETITWFGPFKGKLGLLAKQN